MIPAQPPRGDAAGRPILDPDFSSSLPPRRRLPPPIIPQEYQRLVANPFLAVLYLIASMAAIRFVVLVKNLFLFLAVVASLGLSFLLFQYHCLDCGRTGWLFRWRRHACERVVERQSTGRVRRFRGPTPILQTILWVYLLLGIAVFVAIVSWGSRFAY